MGEENTTDTDDVRREDARAMLTQHWVPEGYAAPNSNVYPWQWLWIRVSTRSCGLRLVTGTEP